MTPSLQILFQAQLFILLQRSFQSQSLPGVAGSGEGEEKSAGAPASPRICLLSGSGLDILQAVLLREPSNGCSL